jgi:hypothetical protein
MTTYPLNPSLPYSIETRNDYVDRYCGMQSSKESYPSPSRREVAALRTWGEEIKKDDVCVKVTLADGNSYFIRQDEAVVTAALHHLHKSLKGKWAMGMYGVKELF